MTLFCSADYSFAQSLFFAANFAILQYCLWNSVVGLLLFHIPSVE